MPGKSTLLNALTGADILAEDKLFATLDPTTRSLKLPSGQEILLTDTVGFIRKLPHHLIDAFKSTLEEAKYADMILHVVDVSNPQADEQMFTVYETLQGLKVQDKPLLPYLINRTDWKEYQLFEILRQTIRFQYLQRLKQDSGICWRRLKRFFASRRFI